MLISGNKFLIILLINFLYSFKKKRKTCILVYHMFLLYIIFFHFPLPSVCCASNLQLLMPDIVPQEKKSRFGRDRPVSDRINTFL